MARTRVRRAKSAVGRAGPRAPPSHPIPRPRGRAPNPPPHHSPISICHAPPSKPLARVHEVGECPSSFYTDPEESLSVRTRCRPWHERTEWVSGQAAPYGPLTIAKCWGASAPRFLCSRTSRCMSVQLAYVRLGRACARTVLTCVAAIEFAHTVEIAQATGLSSA